VQKAVHRQKSILSRVSRGYLFAILGNTAITEQKVGLRAARHPVARHTTHFSRAALQLFFGLRSTYNALSVVAALIAAVCIDEFREAGPSGSCFRHACRLANAPSGVACRFPLKPLPTRP
jgi:hypothetical protein